MKNRQYSQDITLVARRSAQGKSKLFSLSTCLISLTLCVALTVASLGGYYFLAPRGKAGPLVLIHAPQRGAHLVAGKPTTVQAVASDSRKIVRVELWVDGQLLKSETSNVPGGIASFPLLADWQPASAGAHIVLVRAFNALGARAHSTINVNVIADQDGDGTADDADICPDQPGIDISKGCPDRDMDRTPDSADSCPDVAGRPEAAGCATATEGDRDGDGSPDTVDACPDAPGSSLLGGCPDADGDHVADIHDACAAEPGGAGDGCPVPAGDADGDGVADSSDVCPDEWGLPERGGCPEVTLASDDGAVLGTGTRDRDGDGASDEVDPCPDEAGSPENGFCPPPDTEPAPSGGGPGLSDLIPGGETVDNVVVFEALHYELSRVYDEVWCYVQLAHGDIQRYDFEPDDERQWDIALILGGENSVPLGLSEGEPARVFVECFGTTNPVEPPHSLGHITREHPAEDWGGQVIMLDSEGGEGGHFFRAHYRLCASSCDTTGLQPPLITHYLPGEDQIDLDWEWEGDISTISGFKLYLNGNFIQAFTRDVNETTWRPPDGMTCTDGWEFQLTAFSGHNPALPDLESPPSNIVAWEDLPCQERVRITFASLNVHTPHPDEDGRLDQGPIVGDFLIAGGGVLRSLFFDAAHCAVVPFLGEICSGLRLHPGENSIQGILDEIRSSPEACEAGTCAFRADASDTVIIPVDRGYGFTIAGRVIDADEGNPDDTLFNEHVTVSVDSLSPDTTLTLIIPGEHANLTVLIDLFPFDP